MRRWGNFVLCVGIGLVAAGCPKGGSEYSQARKAENLQDLDTALQYYQKPIIRTRETRLIASSSIRFALKRAKFIANRA